MSCLVLISARLIVNNTYIKNIGVAWKRYLDQSVPGFTLRQLSPDAGLVSRGAAVRGNGGGEVWCHGQHEGRVGEEQRVGHYPHHGHRDQHRGDDTFLKASHCHCPSLIVLSGPFTLSAWTAHMNCHWIVRMWDVQCDCLFMKILRPRLSSTEPLSVRHSRKLHTIMLFLHPTRQRQRTKRDDKIIAQWFLHGMQKVLKYT